MILNDTINDNESHNNNEEDESVKYNEVHIND